MNQGEENTFLSVQIKIIAQVLDLINCLHVLTFSFVR
jgi:hypothetical protein